MRWISDDYSFLTNTDCKAWFSDQEYTVRGSYELRHTLLNDTDVESCLHCITLRSDGPESQLGGYYGDMRIQWWAPKDAPKNNNGGSMYSMSTTVNTGENYFLIKGANREYILATRADGVELAGYASSSDIDWWVDRLDTKVKLTIEYHPTGR